MRRLLDLPYIVTELSTAYTDEGIRIWLNARNRNLGRERPIDPLTSGEFDRVLREAERVGGECRTWAMDESLAVRIASAPVITVRDTYSGTRSPPTGAGARRARLRRAMGKEPSPGFPVLYLGKPPASVIVEAYRHLVDPVEDRELRAQIRAHLYSSAPT